MPMIKKCECHICADKPRGSPRNDHRHWLAQIFHELSLNMRELKIVANCEIRLGHRSGGGHLTFAPTSGDLVAADLYNGIETTLVDMAADMGLYFPRLEGSTASNLLRKSIDRTSRLFDAPNGGHDYRNLFQSMHQVHDRLTPPGDRIFLSDTLVSFVTHC